MLLAWPIYIYFSSEGLGILLGNAEADVLLGGGFVAGSHVPQAASFSAVFKYKWLVN